MVQPIAGGYTTCPEYEVNYTYSNGVQLHIQTTKDDSIYGGVINKAGQRNGIRFEGTEGWIWVNRDEIKSNDKQLLTAPLPENAIRLYKSNNHMKNFKTPLSKCKKVFKNAKDSCLFSTSLFT